MIKVRAGLLAGTIILLAGCINPIIRLSEAEAATIQQDISKEQNAKGSKNTVVDLTQVGQSNELTEEEQECIRILASACIYASTRSMEAHLVDLKMLESNDLETELMMQTRFIMSVYDDAYAAEARKCLANVVETIDEDKMLLTQDQLYTLLEMVGAKPSDNLKFYDYLKQWYRNGYYNIEKYYSVGEIFAKIDFVKMEKMRDGNVMVNAVLSLEYDFGPVESYQITLSPNRDSIFQYSVENIRTELIQPDGSGVIGKDDLLRKPYTKPDSISNNPFNYIFELEGALYQMPFPAAELKGNGWEIEEQGDVEPGERRKIHVKKDDTVLTIGLWNYNTVSSALEDCQVVWIKTGRDKDWNRVNFKLAEGVQSGKRKAEVESLYHDYWNEIRTSYSRKDPLYMNQYGYELHFENDLITGFEMGYAPIQEDRQQRIRLMTGNWEQDPKTAPASTNFAVSKNHVYQVDIDGDGVKEEICVKELGGIQWAGYTCIFIDGELNYFIEGSASHQLHCKSMEMIVENGQYFLFFDGWDYANDIHHKIQLLKGWSREAAENTIQKDAFGDGGIFLATGYRGKDEKVIELKTREILETMPADNENYELQKFGYNTIVVETEKTGVYEGSELGLYWRRSSVQWELYPDVQEICEEAFGDYLAPLQGLTEILCHPPYWRRYRTDKESAVISEGRVEFYLFLQGEIALVTIEERPETYYMTFRVLRNEEKEGIRVLEIPPTGGIGIAGNEHRPEIQNYATHTAVINEREPKYSKADIQLVFDDNMQRMLQGIFENYVQALQGLYMLTEQEEYGSKWFCIEDMPTYVFLGYYETTIIKDNYCEFTLMLGYSDRARVTITKEGEEYITTFRLLREEEFKIEERGG